MISVNLFKKQLEVVEMLKEKKELTPLTSSDPVDKFFFDYMTGLYSDYEEVMSAVPKGMEVLTKTWKTMVEGERHKTHYTPVSIYITECLKDMNIIFEPSTSRFRYMTVTEKAFRKMEKEAIELSLKLENWPAQPKSEAALKSEYPDRDPAFIEMVELLTRAGWTVMDAGDYMTFNEIVFSMMASADYNWLGRALFHYAKFVHEISES